jgi:hypothetical protein
VSDDFALQIIQRGKEGNRTVAVIIVGLGADMPFTQGQPRPSWPSWSIIRLIHFCLTSRSGQFAKIAAVHHGQMALQKFGRAGITPPFRPRSKRKIIE